MIKIVLLTPYYYPVIGGITTFVDNLHKNLVKKGHSVFILTNAGEGDSHTKVLRHNKYLFMLKSYSLIRKEKPNVLHSHSHWYILAPCVLYKMLHPKTILVHTFHTEHTDGVRGIKKKMIEFLLSKCDVVTFVSKYLERNIGKDLKIKSQRRAIHPGVTVKQVKEADVKLFKNKYNLGDSTPIISFVSPLVWKMKVEGVKRLIEAFTIIEQVHPKAKLLIVGDGKYRKELEVLSEGKNLGKKVIFTGFVENTFIPLAVTDIYTHISLQETLSFSTLEAMSVGKPVVASNVGGIPELIKNGTTGIIVDPVPKKIASEIAELFNDKERMKRLGEEAKRSVENNFTWSRVVDEYLQVYNSGASRWKDV